MNVVKFLAEYIFKVLLSLSSSYSVSLKRSFMDSLFLFLSISEFIICLSALLLYFSQQTYYSLGRIFIANDHPSRPRGIMMRYKTCGSVQNLWITIIIMWIRAQPYSMAPNKWYNTTI